LSRQALYDFDGTVTSKDTTSLLLIELLKLRPWRFTGVLWFLSRLVSSNNSLSKQEYKNKAIGHLIKNLSESQLRGALHSFSNKVKFTYRQSVLKSIDKSIQDNLTVLIVTASPSFAIKMCVSDFKVLVLGTEFEKKNDIYTGNINGMNCYGCEKVNRINKWAKSNNITLNVETAWSDHISDYDMLHLSRDRNWIGGGKLKKTLAALDPEASFLNIDH